MQFAVRVRFVIVGFLLIREMSVDSCPANAMM